MDLQEEKLREINRYQGIIVDLYVDQVRLPDGSESYREVVIHPGGACVLPVDEEGYAWVEHQFRYPMREVLLEAPAGKIEPGEDPALCAARELKEETGLIAGEMILLGEYYTSPGYSTELLRIYLARDLKAGRSRPDPGEFLQLERIPYDTLLAMAERGEIRDAKTAVAILQARPYLRDAAAQE
ncbi:MAG: NUDIX hydrolase [Oscillospiraceae bacterium]|nr:NUDIX hydrolase [Oscillospiraceae bacterium]